MWFDELYANNNYKTYLQSRSFIVYQKMLGFPGGSVVKNLPANARNTWPGKIPHATEQLSPRTPPMGPLLESLQAKAAKPMYHSYSNSRALEPVPHTVGSLCTTTREPPHSLQLGESHCHKKTQHSQK